MRKFREYVKAIVHGNGYGIKICKEEDVNYIDKKTGACINLDGNEMCIFPKNDGNSYISKVVARKMTGSSWESVEFVFAKENGFQDDFDVSVRFNNFNRIEIRYYYGDAIMSLAPSNSCCLVHNYENKNEELIPIQKLSSKDLLEMILNVVKDAYDQKAWTIEIDRLIKILKPAIALCVNDFHDNWKESIYQSEERTLQAIIEKGKQIEQIKAERGKDGTKEREYNRLIRIRHDLLCELSKIRAAIVYIKNQEHEACFIETMGGFRK